MDCNYELMKLYLSSFAGDLPTKCEMEDQVSHEPMKQPILISAYSFTFVVEH